MSETEKLRKLVEGMELRLAALEETVATMKALAKGDPGLDGKDGRDGRDGATPSARAIASAFLNMMPKADSRPISIEPAVVVHQPALEVAPPNVFVSIGGAESHVHIDGVKDLGSINMPGMADLAKAARELRETMELPVRPIYDSNGKLVGSKRSKEPIPVTHATEK